MVDEIFLKPIGKDDQGWEFLAKFSGQTHQVSITTKYWKQVTHENVSPMETINLALSVALEEKITADLPPTFSAESLVKRLPMIEKRLRSLSQAEAAANPH